MENEELELYKLLATKDNEYDTWLTNEIRWENNKLLVWIPYTWLDEFIQSLRKIFGESLFDEGGFNGNFQADGVCIDLIEILGGYEVNLKKIFSKDKYK